MKLLTLLIFLISSSAFSKDKFGNYVAVGATGTNTTYSKKADCISNESAKPNFKGCFSITGKDMRRFKIAKVDDLEKPNFRPADSSPVKIDCVDFDDCRSKALDPNGDSDFIDRVCIADSSQERWDNLSNWPTVTGISGPWFIWCEKLDGTFKKEDGLVPDPAGTIAADLEDAQKITDESTKRNKRTIRQSALVTCAKTKIADFTASIQKNCLRALAREAVRNRLRANEL